MEIVKVFKALRGIEFWQNVVDGLEKKDIKVYNDCSPADVSIVLGGRIENPIFLEGEKILFYDPKEWRGEFAIYQTVLGEYYNDFINLDEYSDTQKVERIEKYIADKK